MAPQGDSALVSECPIKRVFKGESMWDEVQEEASGQWVDTFLAGGAGIKLCREPGSGVVVRRFSDSCHLSCCH